MPQISTDTQFFNRKRPWSHVKDQVIGHYMPPYLRKVGKLNRPILLIDAFAGPGIYEEDEKLGRSCYGSPITMVTEAEKHAPRNYRAFFGNNNRKHHLRLMSELDKLCIPRDRAQAVWVDSEDLLSSVAASMTDETILLYLDPFGIKGCEWQAILPFLQRGKYYSTEIVINLNVAGLPRLAAKHAMKEGRTSDNIKGNHQILTDVLGGDWWQDILWNDSLTSEEQARLIVTRYTNQLKAYYPYTGYCPVRDRGESRIKYYITFCSRHQDALILHNNNMCNAYNQYIVNRNWEEDSFRRGKRGNNQDQLLLHWMDHRDWKEDLPRNREELDSLILSKVEKANHKGRRPSREDVWVEIIMEPQYFMRWLDSEYRDGVQRLIKAKHGKRLAFVDVKKTGRLNDTSLLYIIED